MSTATHNVNTRRACGSRHFRPTITPRVRKPCRDDSLQFPPVLTTTSLSAAALRPRQDVVRSTGRDETKHIINTKNCRVSVRANLVRGRTKFNYQASVEPCWMIQNHSANSSHFSLVCADRSFISLYFFFFRCVVCLCGAHILEVIKLWIIVKKWSHGVLGVLVFLLPELGACEIGSMQKY